MQVIQCKALLQSLLGNVNGEVLQTAEEYSVEWRIRGSAPNVRKFITFALTESGDVALVASYAIVGIITSREALETLLVDNVGGVDASEYYYSVVEQNRRPLLQLETRQRLRKDATVEEVEALLSELTVFNPLFNPFAPWSAPAGVTALE